MYTRNNNKSALTIYHLCIYKLRSLEPMCFLLRSNNHSQVVLSPTIKTFHRLHNSESISLPNIVDSLVGCVASFRRRIFEQVANKSTPQYMSISNRMLSIIVTFCFLAIVFALTNHSHSHHSTKYFFFRSRCHLFSLHEYIELHKSMGRWNQFIKSAKWNEEVKQ